MNGTTATVSPTTSSSISPTVMTDANVRENYIPDVTARANALLPTTKTTPTDTTSTGGASPTQPAGGGSESDFYDNLYNNYASKVDNAPETNEELAVLNQLRTNGDATTDSAIQNIKDSYKSLAASLSEGERYSTGALKSSLLTSGAARYSPFTSNAILGAKTAADVKSLGDLQNKENAAVVQAQTARDSKDYQLLSKNLDVLEGVRKDKLALADKINTQIMSDAAKARTANIQSSRDSAVAGLVQQGITDPNEILNTLNFQNGKQVGDFTAKEIGDTLKSLSPTGDVTGLSGSVKNFYVLKGRNDLPGNIASLPEDQQLGAYLKYLKTSSSITGTGGKTGSKITLANAKTLGLPLSTVGMTQKDVLDSLQSETPPDWFVEKASTEAGMSFRPESPQLKDAWDEYKTTVTAKATTTPAKQSVSYAKAKEYFSNTYQGLSDDELNTIATQVDTYVNGGMKYADAISQTEKDLSK